MRYRLLASYQGAPYEAGIGPGDSGVVLFAACPPPEELHFEPATGHWRKAVRRGEVQALYESRPVGLFRGERCVVLDDLGDRVHIAYLGHDALKAEQLGYWEVDRGVFELIAPRHEVIDVVEQRLPVAGKSDGLPWYGTNLTGNPTSNGHQSGLLPLEAQAMRAASAAARRGKDTDRDVAGQPPSGRSQPGRAPAIPVTPAGLSEPSAALASGETGALPSWTPNPRVPSGVSVAAGRPALPAAAQAALAQAVPVQAVPVPAVPVQAAEAPAAAPVPAAEAPAAEAPAATPADTVGAPGVQPSAASPATAPTSQDTALAAQPGTQPSKETGEPAEPPAGGAQDLAGAAPAPVTAQVPAQPEPTRSRASRRRRSARRRPATQRIFSELAGQAGIPAHAYAIGEDVEGAMCLVRAGGGFEVFNSVGGARHEVRVFADEESAYFYLFGVLVADAVRTGTLGPIAPQS